MFISKYKGYLAILIAAFCFSSKSILIKLAYQNQVDFVTFLALRMLFSAPFFLMGLFWSFSTKPERVWTISSMIQIFGLALLGYYISSLLNFKGLIYVGAALERLILFIYPTLVVVFGLIFYRKEVQTNIWISLLITYFGIALAVYSQVNIYGNGIGSGIWLIFGSAVTFALYMVWSELVIPVFGHKLFTSIVMLISCVAVFIHYALTHPWHCLFKLPTEAYLLGAAVAILSTVLPSYLMTWGMSIIGSGRTGIFSTFSPIWTIWLAHWVLHEQIDNSQIIGTIFVLIGVYITTLKNQNA